MEFGILRDFLLFIWVEFIFYNILKKEYYKLSIIKLLLFRELF